MTKHVLLALVLAACTTDGRAPLDPDAPVVEIDAAPGEPRNDPGFGVEREPFVATFATPTGAFTAQSVSAHVFNCITIPSAWTLTFHATVAEQDDPQLVVRLELPEWTGTEVTGALAAKATFSDGTHTHDAAATLHATRIDYAGTGTPRVIGRLVIADWSVDQDLALYGFANFCAF